MNNFLGDILAFPWPVDTNSVSVERPHSDSGSSVSLFGEREARGVIGEGTEDERVFCFPLVREVAFLLEGRRGRILLGTICSSVVARTGIARSFPGDPDDESTQVIC